MARTFISYRRTDSAAVAGRIYDRLIARFGRQNVFKDVDDIPPGVNFADYIQSSLRQCAVLLAIIGRDWLETEDSRGQRRLDDPADYVRIELETALDLGLTVIPVLVNHAEMSLAEQLPESLQPLAQINAIAVRNDPDFNADTQRLIAAIERSYAAQRQKPWRQPSRPGILGGRGQAGVGMMPSSPSAAREETSAPDVAAQPAPTTPRARIARPIVPALGAALLLLALAISGLTFGAQAVAALLDAHVQPTETVTATMTATVTATADPTPTVLPGFIQYNGYSGTFIILAPISWTHLAQPDHSRGTVIYFDQFTLNPNVTYSPSVLVAASAAYLTESDDYIISQEVQSPTYSHSTQSVDGVSCARGDFPRDTPGGTVHTATIVCRPQHDAYGYSITLIGRDESFQASFQTYFSPMLASVRFFSQHQGSQPQGSQSQGGG